MKRERHGSGSSFLLAGKRRKEGVGAATTGGPPASAPPRKGEEPLGAASAGAAPGPDMVLLGEFGRAHGLKGEVRLKSYTGDPLAIAGYGPLVGTDGRSYTLANPRQAPGQAPEMLVVRVAGIASREEAETLGRVELFIARDRLPAAADDDEFLLADLIGLDVRSVDGERIGTIVDVPNFGGGDLLEIRPGSGGATAFLPFTRAFVPEVRLAARVVVAAPPDDLFSAAKPDSGEPEDAA